MIFESVDGPIIEIKYTIIPTRSPLKNTDPGSFSPSSLETTAFILTNPSYPGQRSPHVVYQFYAACMNRHRRRDYPAFADLKSVEGQISSS